MAETSASVAAATAQLQRAAGSAAGKVSSHDMHCKSARPHVLRRCFDGLQDGCVFSTSHQIHRKRFQHVSQRRVHCSHL